MRGVPRRGGSHAAEVHTHDPAPHKVVTRQQQDVNVSGHACNFGKNGAGITFLINRSAEDA